MTKLGMYKAVAAHCRDLDQDVTMRLCLDDSRERHLVVTVEDRIDRKVVELREFLNLVDLKEPRTADDFHQLYRKVRRGIERKAAEVLQGTNPAAGFYLRNGVAKICSVDGVVLAHSAQGYPPAWAQDLFQYIGMWANRLNLRDLNIEMEGASL